MKNKKGIVHLIFSPRILLKSFGVLISGLGAFLVFNAYKTTGFSFELFSSSILALLMIAVGQFIFWRT